MLFKKSVKIKREEVYNFFEFAKSNQSLASELEKHGEIVVTLRDKFGTCRFVYRKGKRTLSAKIFKDESTYYAMCWIKETYIEGEADDYQRSRGIRKFRQCVKMLQKATNTGEVLMHIEKSSFGKKEGIPLTEREEQVVDLLRAGKRKSEIEQLLSLSKNRLKKICQSIKQKGITEEQVLEKEIS